jgi:hypothetical protein
MVRAPSLGDPTIVAADESNGYVSNPGTGNVVKMALSGGGTVMTVTGARIRRIQSSLTARPCSQRDRKTRRGSRSASAHVYWTRADGSVWKMAK